MCYIERLSGPTLLDLAHNRSFVSFRLNDRPFDISSTTKHANEVKRSLTHRSLVGRLRARESRIRSAHGQLRFCRRICS